jgi:hypothetical protein
MSNGWLAGGSRVGWLGVSQFGDRVEVEVEDELTVEAAVLRLEVGSHHRATVADHDEVGVTDVARNEYMVWPRTLWPVEIPLADAHLDFPGGH